MDKDKKDQINNTPIVRLDDELEETLHKDDNMFVHSKVMDLK